MNLHRATVYGLWVTKDPFRVSSGYITENTKVEEMIWLNKGKLLRHLDCLSFIECDVYNISPNVQRDVGFRSPW